jgi:DNA-directed RNA polymerase omega subunit
MSEKRPKSEAEEISRFRAVVVAALRAKQLSRGSQPRIELDDKKHKDTTIALEEVRRGLIAFTQSTVTNVHELMKHSETSLERSFGVIRQEEAFGSFQRDEGVMNGLRMLTRPKGPAEANVFYSQRSHGPTYRWHYDEHLDKWHVARVDTSLWSSHELCNARWQSIPEKLKTQLNEHYLE